MNDWLKVIIPVILVSILGWVSTIEVKVSDIKDKQLSAIEHISNIGNNERKLDKLERYLRELEKEVQSIKIEISNHTLLQEQLVDQHPKNHKM